MSSAAIYYGLVNEDGSYSIIARITALSASGEELSPGEGNCITQADVSSISCKVFSLGTNKNNPAGVEVTPPLTLTAANNIIDTLQLTGWPNDVFGYNFRLDVSPTYTANANEWYLVEVKLTLFGGTVVFLKVKVRTQPVQTS